MKESKGNCIEIDIISENCVKILARCNKPLEERQLDSKDSIFQISNNNSLMLSNTLSSVNTIRISKNSLAGSMWMGTADIQNKETPKKNEKNDLIKKNKANILIYDSSKSNSSEIKKQSKFQNLKLEIAKINNFTSSNKKDEDSSDDRDNSNLCSQSVIYLSKNEDGNKLEISNKSIFFTPSTICNYYQPSIYLDNSPNLEDSKRKNKNLDDLLMNEDIIPKTIYMDVASTKLTPPQIRYTRLQLQSCEKNEKLTKNSNNLIISKEIASIKEDNNKVQVKINFEENNNNKFNDIIADKNEIIIKKKEFQTFHDLVKEIRKELVLNISSLDDDVSNNNIVNFDGEEKTQNNSNFYIKNLGLNFCDMKINNELSSFSYQINNNESNIIIPDPKQDNENPKQSRKNCLSCISEINFNIKPENNLNKNKNLSDCNFIIQKPDSINISIEDKKNLPKNNSKQTNYISSLSKNNLLKKTYTRPDNCIIDSYNKLINKGFSSRLKTNSSKKIEKPTHTHNSSQNRSPDNHTKRTYSKQKHKSTYDIISSTKNKILKSILMNLVGNYSEKQAEIINEAAGKNNNKTVISPSNIQTTSATQNSNQKVNTTHSRQDSEKNNKNNYSNCGIVSSKKKEYLDLVKLLSNENNHNRNKQKTPDITQRTNSKGKTYEVTINLDHPNTERIAKNQQSVKKQLTINMSQNDSKSNSLTKKDSNQTNTSFKKITSIKSVLPQNLIKMKSGICEIKNIKKVSIHSNVPINNCPQTVKNNKKNIVSELMNQQKNNNLSSKNNKVFININGKSNLPNNISNPIDCFGQNPNLKAKLSPKENNKNKENSKLFKNENLISSTKNKTNSVKIINNFSNYTKIKKKENSKGKENVYNLSNNSSEKYKKQITSSKIKISGGDEDSVSIDEIENNIN